MDLPTGFIVFLVYLVDQVDIWRSGLDSLIKFLLYGAGVAVIITICSVLFDVAKVSSVVEAVKKLKRWIIAYGVLLAVFFIMSIGIPRNDTMLKMAVAYGAAEVLNSEAANKAMGEISRVSGKAIKAAEVQLDEVINRAPK